MSRNCIILWTNASFFPLEGSAKNVYNGDRSADICVLFVFSHVYITKDKEAAMKLPFNQEQHNGILSRILVVAFGISFASLIVYFDKVWAFIETLFSLASPFFVGFAIAFLLGPVQRKIEAFLQRFIFRKKEKPRIVRLLSTLFSILFLVALVYIFLMILLPQVINSIESIIGYISKFLTNNREYLNSILLKFDWLSVDGDQLVVAWENIVSSQINNITKLLDVTMFISMGIVNFLFDLLVSIITAFYILMDKDRIAAQIKKIGYSIMKQNTIENLIFWTRKANHIFAGFISGKILDSAIIGVICYFCMLIFRMDYPVLISLVIGVTNIIPFFGPFIGWAPCTLILLLVNPISALWFSLFILVLQQLDGNVIGPHILGDSVGVSALSIMIAIIIGGGLFGFTGMLLSVPVYALGYAFFRTLVYDRLRKKNLPTDTDEYVNAPETLKKKEDSE